MFHIPCLAILNAAFSLLNCSRVSREQIAGSGRLVEHVFGCRAAEIEAAYQRGQEVIGVVWIIIVSLFQAMRQIVHWLTARYRHIGDIMKGLKNIKIRRNPGLMFHFRHLININELLPR